MCIIDLSEDRDALNGQSLGLLAEDVKKTACRSVQTQKKRDREYG